MSDDEKINELRLAFVRQDRKISELETQRTKDEWTNRGYATQINKKIEELEKILILDKETAEEMCAETIIDLIISQSDSNKDSIEELEKIIGAKKFYKKDIGSILDDIVALIQKEIAELRNQIQNNSIADLNHYNELKERQKKGEDWVQSLLDLGWNNREVLRKMIKWQGFNEIKKELDTRYQGWLDELDGKKASEKEKKIKIWCYECHDDYFIFDSWNGSECPHCGCWNKKDSGGEKVEAESLRVNPEIPPSVLGKDDNSKPPEPKKKFETGWIDDVFSDFLKDSTYHLEENLPALSEILAQECYEILAQECYEIIEKPLIAEFVNDLKEEYEYNTHTHERIYNLIKKWEARSK